MGLSAHVGLHSFIVLLVIRLLMFAFVYVKAPYNTEVLICIY